MFLQAHNVQLDDFERLCYSCSLLFRRGRNMAIVPMQAQQPAAEEYRVSQEALPAHEIYSSVVAPYLEQIAESAAIPDEDTIKAEEIGKEFFEEAGATPEDVLREPEMYSQELLFFTALSCLDNGDMKTAAECYLAALVRSEVIIALDGDVSLRDYTAFFPLHLLAYMSMNEWTDGEKEQFQEALENAKKNFGAWDQKHPFSITFEKLKKMIEQYIAEGVDQEELDALGGKMFEWTDFEREIIVRRVTRGIVQGIYCDIEDGEDFLAKTSDTYFFNRTSRQYTISEYEDCLTFPIRKGIFPKLDCFGKYSGAIALPSYGTISFGASWSKGKSSEKWLEKEYASKKSGIEEGEDIFTGQKFWIETTLKGKREIAGQPGFHTRSVYRMPSGEIVRIINTLIFAGKNNNLHHIALECTNEGNEEKGLAELEEIARCIRFDK